MQVLTKNRPLIKNQKALILKNPLLSIIRLKMRIIKTLAQEALDSIAPTTDSEMVTDNNLNEGKVTDSLKRTRFQEGSEMLNDSSSNEYDEGEIIEKFKKIRIHHKIKLAY